MSAMAARDGPIILMAATYAIAPADRMMPKSADQPHAAAVSRRFNEPVAVPTANSDPVAPTSTIAI